MPDLFALADELEGSFAPGLEQARRISEAMDEWPRTERQKDTRPDVGEGAWCEKCGMPKGYCGALAPVKLHEEKQQ